MEREKRLTRPETFPRSKRADRSQRFLNVCPDCQAQTLADVPGKLFFV